MGRLSPQPRKLGFQLRLLRLACSGASHVTPACLSFPVSALGTVIGTEDTAVRNVPVYFMLAVGIGGVLSTFSANSFNPQSDPVRWVLLLENVVQRG